MDEENNIPKRNNPQPPAAPQSEQATAPLPGEFNIINLLGDLKVVTNTPSGRPKTLYDGVVIYVDSVSSPSTKRLYVFSRATDDWYYVNLT